MLDKMGDAGYTINKPNSVDDLRNVILEGNSKKYGQEANVFCKVSAEDIISNEKYLDEIESVWGPAPGKHQADGSGVYILGQEFGNVFVGVQPTFGYEGDPMRLLFDKGFAPTHAFSSFYRWIREIYEADAVLHFGMHGALEFMPGKKAGMDENCWPDRLIGDLPNIYLYAANNPSEGSLAKRRSGAVIITHLTPALSQSARHARAAAPWSEKELGPGGIDVRELKALSPQLAAACRHRSLLYSARSVAMPRPPDYTFRMSIQNRMSSTAGGDGLLDSCKSTSPSHLRTHS